MLAVGSWEILRQCADPDKTQLYLGRICILNMAEYVRAQSGRLCLRQTSKKLSEPVKIGGKD